jgi:hypothetical protein
MNEENPDLFAKNNLDGLRARNPYSAMSERFRLTELLETAKYQNDLLAQKCRELEKENFHLAANQCHAGYGGEYGHHRCAEIDRLIKERDEARREVCGFHHLTGFLSGDYAISRGWDCYKNYSGEGFPQSVKDFKEFLNAHSEEDLKTIERLQEENRQLRELKMQGVVSEPVKATPPKYDLGDDQ